MANLPGMNRTESKLFRIQEEIACSKRWQRMTAKVDFEREIDPYIPVPIKVNGRLKSAYALAGNSLIEFSKDFLARASPSLVNRTMRHEMVHVFLRQNDLPDGHNALFRSCCHVLGLSDPTAKECDWPFKHICSECGFWQKSQNRHYRIGHTCKGGVHRWMVTATEYAKLKKVAALNSKVHPCAIDSYVVMRVECGGRNLHLKGAK